MDRIIELISVHLKKTLIDNGFVFIGNNIEIILLCIFLLIVPYLLKLVLFLIQYRKKIFLLKNLNQFYSPDTLKAAIGTYVQPNFQNVDPANELEPNFNQAFVSREKLLPFFLKKAFKYDGAKYYLVLADSGMGKTSLMINLYYNFNKRLFGNLHEAVLIPISGDLDKLVADIPNKNTKILLLDALDEDPGALRDIHGRLLELIQISKGFFKVVITSRTQFFSSDQEIPSEVGDIIFSPKGNSSHTFKRIYISAFSDSDIRTFLNKKYGYFSLFNRKKIHANAVIKRSPNMMVRPMLLGFIDDLVSSGKSYLPYQHSVYEVLIRKWLDREAARVPAARRDEYKQQLFDFSVQVAVFIEKNRTNNGVYIPKEIVVKIGRQYALELSDLELQGRSLLNHNTDGNIKFAHKSILEYFIALATFRDRTYGIRNDGTFAIDDSSDLDQANSFLREMIELSKYTGPSGQYHFLQNLNFVRNIIYPFASTTIKSFRDLIAIVQRAKDFYGVKANGSDSNDTRVGYVFDNEDMSHLYLREIDLFNWSHFNEIAGNELSLKEQKIDIKTENLNYMGSLPVIYQISETTVAAKVFHLYYWNSRPRMNGADYLEFMQNSMLIPPEADRIQPFPF